MTANRCGKNWKVFWVTNGNDDIHALRQHLIALLENFDHELKSGVLRSKVLSLIPVINTIREIGKRLVSDRYIASARDRILFYFRKYPGIAINGNELLVVSGIQEYARRVRELRVQFGWSIYSGLTLKQMDEHEALPPELQNVSIADYVFIDRPQDREMAHRWHLANSIRRRKDSVRDRILQYLRANVGKTVTGEELRYVAKDKTEWARRVRELRSEHGWPIATRTTGRPDLRVGDYVLEADRQSPQHDRNIPDAIRSEVLRRDEYRCKICGWSHAEWNPSDPRHLELHHVTPHKDRGKNEPSNLTTLCTVCHDKLHRNDSSS